MAGPTDQELEISIAQMLRFGVVLSALVVVAGAVLGLRGGSAGVPDYAHFAGTAAGLRTIGSVARGAGHLEGAAVIQLGLLLLIATPIARVVLCAVGFARQRDLLYVGVSVMVLMILIFSLVRGAL